MCFKAGWAGKEKEKFHTSADNCHHFHRLQYKPDGCSGQGCMEGISLIAVQSYEVQFIGRYLTRLSYYYLKINMSTRYICVFSMIVKINCNFHCFWFLCREFFVICS
jgi:hypothetical protein